MLESQVERRSVQDESLFAASKAGLRFVSDGERGLYRQIHGRRVRYVDASGRAIRDPDVLARIPRLAIPPAWSDVWICATEAGHIQATGRDSRNRKQYRYHPNWQRTRDEAKFDHLIAFAQGLAHLRETVRRHMSEAGLGRRKVLATLVHLLETTLIRVGNKEYARENRSYGLTTLKDQHVSLEGSNIRFKFRGKTGKEWRLKITDRRISRIVRACQDLPGQHLLQYEDDDGVVRQVTSADVNDYLREYAGPGVSAKDFRTWAGTVLAVMALREFASIDKDAATKATVKRAIEAVASQLGNTATICRKCYVHPEVLNCYLEGTLLQTLNQRINKRLREDMAKLRPEESATLALLHARLNK